MKKNVLVGLTLFFSLCLVLFACRKDIDNFVKGREAPASMQLEAAKIWRLQHLEGNSNRKILTPHWKYAWTV